MKRTLTILMTVVLLTLAASPALAAPKGRVDLKTKRTATVLEGSTTWVALSWGAKNAQASDFRVEAKSSTRGVVIAYPENTHDYTSLMDNDTLSDGEIDFTALKISVPYGTRRAKLTVVATWTEDGETRVKKYNVAVPVAKFKGNEDLVQSSDEAGSVSAGKPAWLGVDWTGVAPSIKDVRMTVSGQDGAIITYPEAKNGVRGTYTSLWYDDTLVAGETDVARFRIDASEMKPGSYTLELKLSYTKGDTNNTVKGRISFTVEP